MRRDPPSGRSSRAAGDPASRPDRRGRGTFADRVRRERASSTAMAGAAVLGRRGCFEFRVEDVAVAAGVGKGTVYLDHGSKVGLLERALAGACEEVGRRLAELEALPDALERLREAIRLLARLARERPDLAVLVEGRLACAGRWAGADVAPFEELERRLTAIAAGAIRAAGIGPLDPRVLTQVLLALVRPSEARPAPDPSAVLRQATTMMPWLQRDRGPAG